MSIYSGKNKFVSYLIILISLFILILFTKDQITKIQENNDLKETYTIDLDNKKTKLSELNELKSRISTWSGLDTSKYNVEIKEDEIIDFIYSYIEKNNGKDWIIFVKNISISEPQDTEIGFKETTINLNLRISNENKLKEILDFLVSSKSKYNFFISSFTYPYGKIDKSFNVSIPLKILHK